MIFLPHNRNISVELIESEKAEEGTILLPSDYRVATEPYAIVRIAEHGAADDCQSSWRAGWLLVVEAQMIREFSFEEKTFYTIAENYVIGAIKE